MESLRDPILQLQHIVDQLNSQEFILDTNNGIAYEGEGFSFYVICGPDTYNPKWNTCFFSLTIRGGTYDMYQCIRMHMNTGYGYSDHSLLGHDNHGQHNIGSVPQGQFPIQFKLDPRWLEWLYVEHLNEQLKRSPLSIQSGGVQSLAKGVEAVIFTSWTSDEHWQVGFYFSEIDAREIVLTSEAREIKGNTVRGFLLLHDVKKGEQYIVQVGHKNTQENTATQPQLMSSAKER